LKTAVDHLRRGPAAVGYNFSESIAKISALMFAGKSAWGADATDCGLAPIHRLSKLRWFEAPE
jgi:hypothetical protein